MYKRVRRYSQIGKEKGNSMALAEGLLKGLDEEIKRLTEVRRLLSPAVKRGRPKGANGKKKTVRRLTPEGRKKIAAAMRKRWAERKKAAKK